MSNYDLAKNRAKKELRDGLIREFMGKAIAGYCASNCSYWDADTLSKHAYDQAENAADLYLEKTGLGLRVEK